MARSCEWQIRERWKLPPGETMQVSRGTAVGRKAPGRAQQQLLMDGTAVESAFALLLANALTKYLNVKSGRLLDEYHVRYENRAKHSGRQVKLTYMIIDNVEYEVID